MKYKIMCRSYRDWKEYPLLCESYLEFEARFFKIENGFVALWFEDNDTRNPDTYINANDVLIIDRIGEEKE